MPKNSKIGWTHHSWNPWWGCQKVTAECDHCYIDAIMRRGGHEPFGGPMRTKTWRQPFGWDREAASAGERHRVFTCSMSDFFHQGADEWRPEAWKIIEACKSLDWLILTKRPHLIKDRLPADWGSGYPNVWLGVTCGCSQSLYRLPILREITAAVKFVSAEPLLERMDFREHLGWIDWIITGCERAAKGERRFMDMDWVRDIDLQCKEAAKSHFFKQAYPTNGGAEHGIPCEEPGLDGQIVQEFPARRTALTVVA
jgi:protein gp37